MSIYSPIARPSFLAVTTPLSSIVITSVFSGRVSKYHSFTSVVNPCKNGNSGFITMSGSIKKVSPTCSYLDMICGISNVGIPRIEPTL